MDLTTLSYNVWQHLGPEGTKTCFLWLEPGVSLNWPDGVQDNTHFQAHGAIAVARLIVRDMVRQWLLPPSFVENLNAPIPGSALKWPQTVA